MLIVLGLSMACNSAQKTVVEQPVDTVKQKADSKVYATTITEEELKEHLYTYASDDFEGRETGQPGQKKAVAYLKEHYEAMGIKAAKADGNYFQEVPLELSNPRWRKTPYLQLYESKP